jgi:hypothetical protein
MPPQNNLTKPPHEDLEILFSCCQLATLTGATGPRQRFVIWILDLFGIWCLELGNFSHAPYALTVWGLPGILLGEDPGSSRMALNAGKDGF